MKSLIPNLEFLALCHLPERQIPASDIRMKHSIAKHFLPQDL